MDLYVVDAREEDVAYDGIGIVYAVAVGANAARSGGGVRARGDEVAVRDGASDQNGEVAEGLAHLLLAR